MKRRSAGWCLVLFEELLFIYATGTFFLRFLHGYQFEEYSRADILMGSIFIFLLLMCQCCFFQASNADPGYVTEKLIQECLHKDEHFFESTSTQRKQNGEIRRCNKCRLIKPDRAHHCSVCNKCVLKMDHHCPFINNCIGFFNYKYFFIFLFWTISFSFYVTGCMAYHGYYHYKANKSFDYYEIVAGILCIIVIFFLMILFSNHVRFVFYNLTTIEYVEKKATSRHPYNLGFGRNVVEIFGSNPFLWLIPLWTTKGEGMSFRYQQESSSLLLHT